MLGPLAQEGLLHMILMMLVAGVLLGFYVLPSWIAWRLAHHHRTAIALVNLLLGWTVVGWIGALVWSTRPPRVSPTARRAPADIAPPRA